MKVYNFGFFGSMREPDPLSGHITVSVVGNEFAFVEMRDYGGFTYEGENTPLPKITDSIIRQMHDHLLHEGNINKEGSKIKGLTYFPLGSKNTSANIQLGDTVLDTETGKTFLVDHGYDIRFINKNQFYQPVGREALWTVKKTKDRFIEQLKGVDPLKDWKIIETLPKHKETWKQKSLEFDSHKLDLFGNYNLNKYWIRLNGVLYEKWTGIYAPAIDAIEHLTLSVLRSKSVLEVKCNSFDSNGKVRNWSEDTYKLFTEPESYAYNNATIRLIGES